MGRLIDETEVMRDIDAIRPVDPQKSDYAHGIDVGLAMAKLAIKEQQTAQQWIPCTSTKRPKNREEVMVTIDDGYQRYTDTDEFVNGQYWYHDNKQVVAWKPFDEPWKGEQK